MDLLQKIRTIPTDPGVYLYKNAEGEVIYVGKAKNLRSRVGSYFHEGRWTDAKTGTLVREAVDVDYIVVANNKEALALENNLIKQRKPRFNILLRDDKTYPYVKLTLGERFPRVYVTRRLRKYPGPPQEDQKTTESSVPRMPTTMRIQPTVCRLMAPPVSTLIAKARIAPTAIRKIPAPMPINKPPIGAINF